MTDDGQTTLDPPEIDNDDDGGDDDDDVTQVAVQIYAPGGFSVNASVIVDEEELANSAADLEEHIAEAIIMAVNGATCMRGMGMWMAMQHAYGAASAQGGGADG